MNVTDTTDSRCTAAEFRNISNKPNVSG